MKNTLKVLLLCSLITLSIVPLKAHAGFLLGYVVGSSSANSSCERTNNDLKSENTALKRQVRDLTEQLAVEKQKNEVPKKHAIKK